MKHSLLLAGVMLVSAATLGAATGTDVSWIEGLPGVSSTAVNRRPGQLKVVYSISGDAKGTLGRLAAGLQSRGWRVRRSASASAGVAGFEGLSARKGHATLKARLTGAGTRPSLLVNLYGAKAESLEVKAAAAAPPPAGEPVATERDVPAGSDSRAPSSEAVVADSREGERPATVSDEEASVAADARSGEAVEDDSRSAGVETRSPRRKRMRVEDDDVERRIECDGTTVLIDGDDCEITLSGECHRLAIRGDDNEVVIEGEIAMIELYGDDNSVSWSAAANEDAPKVKDRGEGNRVRRSQRH